MVGFGGGCWEMQGLQTSHVDVRNTQSFVLAKAKTAVRGGFRRCWYRPQECDLGQEEENHLGYCHTKT